MGANASAGRAAEAAKASDRLRLSKPGAFPADRRLSILRA
jgi:hypothetical protein